MIKKILILAFILTSMGCAATQIALEHKDLKTQVQMSETIFLEVSDNMEKSIYVDIKNTSDKSLEIEDKVIARLIKDGYEIKNKPSDAFYILQGNILSVGKADPSALKESVHGGYGGAIGGAAIGGAIAGNVTGALAGGLIAGAGDLIAGSLVKNVTYAIVTDIQISERTSDTVKQVVESSLKQGTGSSVQQSSSSIKNRRKYQTRIASSANKVNLEFEETKLELEDALSRSIAGIF